LLTILLCFGEFQIVPNIQSNKIFDMHSIPNTIYVPINLTASNNKSFAYHSKAAFNCCCYRNRLSIKEGSSSHTSMIKEVPTSLMSFQWHISHFQCPLPMSDFYSINQVVRGPKGETHSHIYLSKAHPSGVFIEAIFNREHP
jgi:hypothetical protein